MPHPYLIKLSSNDDAIILWIRKNTKFPKWKWDKRFPKRTGYLQGVYLSGEDALLVKLRFNL